MSRSVGDGWMGGWVEEELSILTSFRPSAEAETTPTTSIAKGDATRTGHSLSPFPSTHTGDFP